MSLADTPSRSRSCCVRSSSSHWPKLVPSSNGTQRLGSATSKCRPRCLSWSSSITRSSSRPTTYAHGLIVYPGNGSSSVAAPPSRSRRPGPGEPLAALEHEDGLAGFREVRRGGEAVVAAADHDDIPVLGGELGDR